MCRPGSSRRWRGRGAPGSSAGRRPLPGGAWRTNAGARGAKPAQPRPASKPTSAAACGRPRSRVAAPSATGRAPARRDVRQARAGWPPGIGEGPFAPALRSASGAPSTPSRRRVSAPRRSRSRSGQGSRSPRRASRTSTPVRTSPDPGSRAECAPGSDPRAPRPGHVRGLAVGAARASASAAARQGSTRSPPLSTFRRRSSARRPACGRCWTSPDRARKGRPRTHAGRGSADRAAPTPALSPSPPAP